MAVDPVARSIATAQDCLRRLERDHRQVVANMAAGAIPATIGVSVSTDPAGTVTWTPTEAAGNLRLRTQVTRYQQLIEYALVNLLEADLLRGLNVTANTTPIVEKERCDGGARDWANPSCEANAVRGNRGTTPLWIDGRQHQLCQTCWDRYRKQKSRAIT
jgi:hypothetical protein